MRNNFLAAVALSSFGVTGLQAQGSPTYEWIIRTPDGPFSLTVPSVTLATTGTKIFEITMSDWDKFEDPQNWGTFASMGNLGAELSTVSPSALPSGITLDFDSVVSASVVTQVHRYKFTTSNSAATPFTILWKLKDVAGWDLITDVQVGKDSDQFCLQSVGF